MATQDPNSWEKLLQLIQNDARTNESSRKLVEMLHGFAQTNNDTDYFKHVRELLEYAQEKFTNLPELSPNDVLREAETWRNDLYPLGDAHNQPSQQETPPQQGFQLFSRNKKQPTGGGGLPQKKKTETTKQILSIQEAELLQRFKEIDNMEPGEARDAAIEEFLNSLDAPSLLRGQHSILLSHIQQLGIGEDDERHKTVREFLGQREERVDKGWEERITEEERAKRRQAARSLFRNPHDPDQLSTTQRRSQLQNLIRNRQDEIHGAYGDLFEIQEIMEFFDQQELYAKLLLGLNQTMEARQQQQEEQQAESAAQAQETPQRPSAAPQPPIAPRAKRGASKALSRIVGNLKKQALGKIKKAIIQVILKNPYILAAIGIILLVIVAVFIVVFIIVSLVGGGQNNQPTNQGGISAIHPTPPPYPGDLAGAINSRFGITMSGYDRLHLQWAWDKFWEISNTNFFALTENRTIVHNTGGGSFVTCGYGIQIAFIHLIHYCDAYVRSAPDQNLFDVLLTHELSHTVQFTNSSSKSFSSDLPGVIVKEGYVTYYAQLNCLGSNQFYEDYAEMLTYYLNPNSEQTTACKHGPNPYINGGHPLYKALAQKILGPF